MQTNYTEILERIAEPPLWWDEKGVPRYVEFSPWRVVDGMSDEIALMLVACHQCGREFRVAMSRANMHVGSIRNLDGSPVTMKDLIRCGEIHYGDPPCVFCCSAGYTMGSVPQRVLEFWHRDHKRPAPGVRPTDLSFLDHDREPAYEIAIDPGS